MKKKVFAFLAVASLVFLLFLWAPWITDEYAINLVVEKLVDQKLASIIWGRT
jgi:hypothetical protein